MPKLLGPAFHHLFPTARCMKQPKLVTLVSFFTQLGLAYDGVRAALWQLKIDVASTNGPQVSTAVRNQIHNLVLLFECFLPKVCDEFCCQQPVQLLITPTPTNPGEGLWGVVEVRKVSTIFQGSSAALACVSRSPPRGHLLSRSSSLLASVGTLEETLAETFCDA